MRIELRRLIPLVFEPEVVRERLLAWARLSGFIRIHERPDGWTLNRGNGWRALITFDIRKVPTTVHLLHLPLSASLACSLVASAWGGMETAGDRPKLEQDLDDLEGFLNDGRIPDVAGVADRFPLSRPPDSDRVIGHPDAFRRA